MKRTEKRLVTWSRMARHLKELVELDPDSTETDPQYMALAAIYRDLSLPNHNAEALFSKARRAAKRGDVEGVLAAHSYLSEERFNRVLDRSTFSAEYQPPSIWRISRRSTSSRVIVLPAMLIRRT